MCLWASNMKKYEKKIFFLASLKLKKKGVGSGRIRIRIHWSEVRIRIPNNDFNGRLYYLEHKMLPVKKGCWLVSKQKKSIFWPPNIGLSDCALMICWQALVKFFCQGVKKAQTRWAVKANKKKLMLWKNLPKKADRYSMIMLMFTLLWTVVNNVFGQKIFQFFKKTCTDVSIHA